MEELFKNSLMGQLNKLGLNTDGVKNNSVVPDEVEDAVLSGPNPLLISVNEEDIKNSPFINSNMDNPLKETVDETTEEKVKDSFNEVSKKRLNDLDLNILQDSAVKKAQDEFSGGSVFGKILYKYFPEIYKGFLIKKALNKLKSINQTAVELISKKIPYGESDERYNALINYISSSNTIQAKLMKKI